MTLDTIDNTLAIEVKTLLTNSQTAKDRVTRFQFSHPLGHNELGSGTEWCRKINIITYISWENIDQERPSQTWWI